MDRACAVAVAFFGDGAASQGVVAEVLNVAALWRLPLILVCENNGFAEFSPTADVTAGAIATRGEPFGVPGHALDGNDVEAVWETAGEAVRRARAGSGPSLIEARTYRIRGHVETEQSFLSRAYREDAEIGEWMACDPLFRFATQLTGSGTATQRELDAIDAEVAEAVAAAYAQASADPLPTESSAFAHMLA
ncbi:MAG: thiamine pyrophosphate-dependent enzyme [Burkholderiales bacterium]|nr:thiamine pyrophosphate-dependent enzyme [Burkholderiales bacterium]